jgi:peptidoglycan/xylan/chitin deacetylase (PgdA/CDA1 family)
MKTLLYRAASSRFSPFPRILGSRRRESLGFLVLHGVHSEEFEQIAVPPSSSIPISSFESNLRALKKKFTVVSIDHGLEMLNGTRQWKDDCVVLTFDDSLKCTAEIAAPLLEKYGVPATVYLSTDIIDTPYAYWWLRLDYAIRSWDGLEENIEMPDGTVIEMTYSNRLDCLRRFKSQMRQSPADIRDAWVSTAEEQLGMAIGEKIMERYPYATPLSWDDVRKLTSAGFTVGCHTASHPNLTLLDDAELKFEIQHSRSRIETETDAKCSHFCYPYGLHSAEVVHAVERVGFESAVTTIGPGWNRADAKRSRLKRFNYTRVPEKLPYVLYGISNLAQRLQLRG